MLRNFVGNGCVPFRTESLKESSKMEAKKGASDTLWSTEKPKGGGGECSAALLGHHCYTEGQPDLIVYNN